MEDIKLSKLAIIMAMMIISSGHFIAFGCHDEKEIMDDIGNKSTTLRSLTKTDDITEPRDSRFGILPKNILQLIFKEASNIGTDPRSLRLISRHWAHSMRYDVPEAGPEKTDKAGISYTNPTNDHFMEDCMRIYMEGLFSRAALYFKKGEPAERIKYFSDFQDSAADLYDCERFDNFMVSTNSIERLKIARGINGCKLVIFMGSFHKASHLLPTDAKGNISDVVVIWKMGKEELRDKQGNIQFDYLITKPSLLSKSNMFENWKKGVNGQARNVPKDSIGMDKFFSISFNTE